MKRTLLALSSIALFAGCSASAAPSEITSETAKAVADHLFPHRVDPIGKEAAVSAFMSVIETYDTDGDGLEREEVETGDAVMRAESAAGSSSVFLMYDLNADLEITKDEVAYIHAVEMGNFQNDLNRIEGTFRAYDQDTNGIVSWEEMKVGSGSGRGLPSIGDRVLVVAALVDQDGRFTAEDVVHLLDMVFARFDHDRDQVLSIEEGFELTGESLVQAICDGSYVVDFAYHIYPNSSECENLESKIE